MPVSRARVALALAVIGGCSDAQGSGRCATRVTPEVCQTPANLRGAARVSETWTSAPAPELVPQPLLDGRYVQTARTLYCAEQYDPPPVLSSAQGILEISGCVLRVTAYLGADAEPVIGVRSFDYRADGTLELRIECSTEQQQSVEARYGFDGTTLLLPDSSSASGPDGQAYACDYLDSWELR